MPDISMCSNRSCPRHLKCYRFMARPDKWQSYGSFKPKKGKCEYFYAMPKPRSGSEVADFLIDAFSRVNIEKDK